MENSEVQQAKAAIDVTIAAQPVPQQLGSPAQPK
jgi:hypothetical protein